MDTTYRTCTHALDTGGLCNSAAVTNQRYCAFHLRYRARQLRMAQMRARCERFHLQIPPLESMYAVQSALSQLAEAVAADMIDPKRANSLLSILRLASLNLRHPEKWQTNLYHSDQPAEVNLAQEFGLPRDLDLDTPPEVAFPSPPASASGDRPLAAANCFSSPMPTAGFCSEHGYDCPDLVIRADHPVTPEAVEIHEIAQTQGSDAAARRGNQLERNRQRRQLRAVRKRYAAIALEKNMRLAAEKLAEQKLAAQRSAEKATAQSESGPVAPPMNKKPPATAVDPETGSGEAQKTA